MACDEAGKTRRRRLAAISASSAKCRPGGLCHPRVWMPSHAVMRWQLKYSASACRGRSSKRSVNLCKSGRCRNRDGQPKSWMASKCDELQRLAARPACDRGSKFLSVAEETGSGELRDYRPDGNAARSGRPHYAAARQPKNATFNGTSSGTRSAANRNRAEAHATGAGSGQPSSFVGDLKQSI